MAEENESDGEEGEEQPKSKKMLFIIIGAVVVLLGGGAGGAWYMGLFGGKEEKKEAMATVEEIPKPHFFELPEVTVNIATGGGPSRYLKINISLEVENEEVSKLIKPLIPRIMNAFQVYLRELRPIDLQGSAGLFRLKAELQRRINIAIHPAKINDVLFQEILLQ